MAESNPNLHPVQFPAQEPGKSDYKCAPCGHEFQTTGNALYVVCPNCHKHAKRVKR